MSIRFAAHMISAFIIGALPNLIWGLNPWDWKWWVIIVPSLIVLNLFFKPKNKTK